MDLSAAHGVLYSYCHISARNCLENESEYQAMKKKKRFDAVKLFQLINKNCNGSTTVVTSDKVGNMIEALRNFMLVRAEEYPSLPKYIEASEHLFRVLEATGFSIATEMLRDEYVSELVARGQTGSSIY